MQLTILGSGGAIPDGQRMQSGYLIETDDETLLIDCGSGVLHRIAQAGVAISDIDQVLLTHHHLDHTADLLPLLKGRWLIGAGELAIHGPPRTVAFLDTLLEPFEYLRDRVSMVPHDLEVGKHTIGSMVITAVETIHSIQCYAYRISGDDWTVTISGDTEASPSVAELADGSDILIHDCSFPDEVTLSNHPTPSSLAAVVAPISVPTLVLSHFYPMAAGNEAAMSATIQESIEGEVVIGTDLQTFVL